MKKIIGLLLVLALAVTACGDDDAASLDSCEGIADATNHTILVPGVDGSDPFTDTESGSNGSPLPLWVPLAALVAVALRRRTRHPEARGAGGVQRQRVGKTGG